jgi:hypothetical protein
MEVEGFGTLSVSAVKRLRLEDLLKVATTMGVDHVAGVLRKDLLRLVLAKYTEQVAAAAAAPGSEEEAGADTTETSTAGAASTAAPAAMSTAAPATAVATVADSTVTALLERMVRLEAEHKERARETETLREALAVAEERAAVAGLVATAEKRYPPRAFQQARSQHEFDSWRRVAALLHRVTLGDDVDLVAEALSLVEARMTAVVLGDQGEWAAASALQGIEDEWLLEHKDEVERARKEAAAIAAVTKKPVATHATARTPATTPAQRTGPTEAAAPAKSVSTAGCFQCGARDHLKRDCPTLKLRKAGSGGSGTGASGTTN